jgi:hypothetical protein
MYKNIIFVLILLNLFVLMCELIDVSTDVDEISSSTETLHGKL